MKAIHRIINSVWTLEYEPVSESEVKLLRFSRDDKEGYERERELPKGDVVESSYGKRTVIGITVEGKEYKVINPQYAFSYNRN